MGKNMNQSQKKFQSRPQNRVSPNEMNVTEYDFFGTTNV